MYTASRESESFLLVSLDASVIEGLFDDLRNTMALELLSVLPKCLYKTPNLEDVELAVRMLDKYIDDIHIATPRHHAYGHHGGGGGKPIKVETLKLDMGNEK